MKVITDRYTKTYHVDCTRCNSTLEITTDEVKVCRLRYDKETGSGILPWQRTNDPGLTIDCPACNDYFHSYLSETKIRSEYLGNRRQKGNALPIITVTKLHTKTTRVEIGLTYILLGRVKTDRSHEYKFKFIHDENFEYCLLWDLKLGQTFLDVVSRDDLCEEW